MVLLLLGMATIFIVYRQRRDAEVALREREGLFRALLEGVGTDYLIYRLTIEDEVYRYLTPAIERFTGVPSK